MSSPKPVYLLDRDLVNSLTQMQLTSSTDKTHVLSDDVKLEPESSQREVVIEKNKVIDWKSEREIDEAYTQEKNILNVAKHKLAFTATYQHYFSSVSLPVIADTESFINRVRKIFKDEKTEEEKISQHEQDIVACEREVNKLSLTFSTLHAAVSEVSERVKETTEKGADVEEQSASPKKVMEYKKPVSSDIVSVVSEVLQSAKKLTKEVAAIETEQAILSISSGDKSSVTTDAIQLVPEVLQPVKESAKGIATASKQDILTRANERMEQVKTDIIAEKKRLKKQGRVIFSMFIKHTKTTELAVMAHIASILETSVERMQKEIEDLRISQKELSKLQDIKAAMAVDGDALNKGITISTAEKGTAISVDATAEDELNKNIGISAAVSPSEDEAHEIHAQKLSAVEERNTNVTV